MTIDEAIVHEKELAKEIYVEAMLCHANPDDEKLDGYIENGRYHEQVAEWLEELKSYRASVFSGDMTQKMLKEQYCKGVDDFATKICEILEEYQTGFNMVSMANVWHFSRELEEQLKAGVSSGTDSQ